MYSSFQSVIWWWFQAEALDVQVKYASLKEEAADLTKKLKIFEKKYSEAKQEVRTIYWLWNVSKTFFASFS